MKSYDSFTRWCAMFCVYVACLFSSTLCADGLATFALSPSSKYSSRTLIDQQGSTWFATECAIRDTMLCDSAIPVIRNGGTFDMTSAVAAPLSIIEVMYGAAVKSDSGTVFRFDILVNDTVVATVQETLTIGVVRTARFQLETPLTSGTFTLSIRNTGGRVGASRLGLVSIAWWADPEPFVVHVEGWKAYVHTDAEFVVKFFPMGGVAPYTLSYMFRGQRVNVAEPIYTEGYVETGLKAPAFPTTTTLTVWADDSAGHSYTTALTLEALEPATQATDLVAQHVTYEQATVRWYPASDCTNQTLYVSTDSNFDNTNVVVVLPPEDWIRTETGVELAEPFVMDEELQSRLVSNYIHIEGTNGLAVAEYSVDNRMTWLPLRGSVPTKPDMPEQFILRIRGAVEAPSATTLFLFVYPAYRLEVNLERDVDRYVLEGLTPNTPIYTRVRSRFDERTANSLSETLSFTTLPVPQPEVPTLMGATVRWHYADEDVPLITSVRLYAQTNSVTFIDPIQITGYLESSSLKIIRLSNTSTEPQDLAAYQLKMCRNGTPTWILPFTLSGTLAPNASICYARTTLTDATLPDPCVITNKSVLNFNGDDPIGLFHGTATQPISRVEGGEDVLLCLGPTGVMQSYPTQDLSPLSTQWNADSYMLVQSAQTAATTLRLNFPPTQTPCRLELQGCLGAYLSASNTVWEFRSPGPGTGGFSFWLY